MNENKKKFRLMDAILAVICVVFVAEAAAPVAAIGNSQYFWWIFMIIGFLLPYGLISAELGTTYDGEGGLYDWISKAYGRRMGSRTAWYYWVNFPLWMASLAVMFPEIIGICTGANISTWLSLLIQLAFCVDCSVDQFLPCFRQRLDSQPVRLHQAAAGRLHRSAGNLHSGHKRCGE